jgi:hypothetical protein
MCADWLATSAQAHFRSVLVAAGFVRGSVVFYSNLRAPYPALAYNSFCAVAVKGMSPCICSGSEH